MVVEGRTAPPAFVRLASHPVRWRLMLALAESDLRVRELVALVGEPQSLVSYHLRLLRDGGLVTSRRSSLDARDTYYRLDLDRCATALAAAGSALHPSLVPSGPPARTPAAPAAPVRSVLFVCTGNSARSPIAEALLRRHAGDRVRVASAGTRPKERIHPHAVRVLREEYAVDLAGRSPRALSAVRGRPFDRVVTLCDKAREALAGAADPVPGTRTHWSMPDPAGPDSHGSHGGQDGSYAAFASAAHDIDLRVRRLLPSLVADPTIPTETQEQP